MGVNIVGCELGWLVLHSRGGWSWGWRSISGAVGLWGHWFILVRVSLIAFVIFFHVEGAREVGFCCIGGEEWGEVRDKGHC
jgi:hypothetical protein